MKNVHCSKAKSLKLLDLNACTTPVQHADTKKMKRAQALQLRNKQTLHDAEERNSIDLRLGRGCYRAG